jgi:hypothetical protein
MKKISFMLAMIVSVQGFCNDASPVAFYKDLIAAISNIQGTVYLSLGDGYWEKKLPTADIIWNNDHNTVATFSFSYSAGNLQKGSYLAFSPAVHIWVRNGTQGLSLAIDTVNFNVIGQVQDWHVRYDNAHHQVINPRELTKIQNALSADIKVTNLFNGQIFTNYLNPVSVNQQLNPQAKATPFVTQIYFLASSTQPGLNINFNKGATLHFSKQNNQNLFDNFITFSQTNNSNVKFDYLKLDLVDNTIQGSLSNFNAFVDNGKISTGSGMTLNLLPGSGIAFSQLNFQNAGSFTSIDCTSGSLTAAVGGGSRINLTTDVKNPSYLVFNDNSTVNLNGFSLDIQDKKATNIHISSGSSISLTIFDAQLGIGHESFVNLGNGGQLNGNLDGDWSSGSAPDVNLQINLLNCPISGGRFILNKATDLSLSSGSIKSDGLTLKGLNYQGITGRITEFIVNFQSGSKFGLPNGLQVVNGADNSSFVGATAANPMILKASYPYPLSNYVFKINFSAFRNSEFAVFGLQNGSLLMNLQNFDNDSISLTNSSVSGQFSFATNDAQIRGLCSIYNIQGNEKKGLPDSIAGKIRLNIYPGLSYDIHTPFVKGPGGDERSWPLNLIINSHDSILSSEGNISFNGRILTINNLNYKTALELVVPAGKGEHENNDDPNSADGTHPGDDQLKTGQEAYSDVEKVCKVHVYLLPYTYTVRGQFYIQTDGNNTINFSLDHLSLDNPITDGVNYKKDGCSDIIGVICGAVLGSLTGGAGGAVVLGIIGGIAANDIESSIKTRLLAEFASKIESEKQSWKLISF